jgi:phosphoglycerol transferase
VTRTRVVPYIWSAFVALLGAFAVLHLWHMRVGIPLYYSHGGDELMVLTWTKAMIDGGWYATISHLGAPFAMSTADFPLSNLLHLIVLRLITLVVHHAPVALNLYFIAGFPLIALVSTYVLRRLGISSGAAVAMSVVYALLPFRFMRNEAGLFYDQYYLLPLLVLAIVWVLRDHALFDTTARHPTRDGYIFLVSLLALSWDNEYSAAFGVMLLAFAAAASYVRTRAWRGAIAALLGIVVIFVGVEIELLPTTIYQSHQGKNTAIVPMPPQASEFYALSLAQLVLPIQNHRIRKLSKARARFDSPFPLLIDENSSATLGALGALGFVGTLAALLLVRTERDGDLWPELSRINLATFLIATVGGVGALLSYYFFPELQLYNRISPLIGFVSLVAVALVLDTIRRRWLAEWNGLWAGGLALLMALAIFDQTSASYVPPYAADLQAYSGDGSFAATLESRLAPNAHVYQLPHVPFPSNAPVELLGPWDQTALYLQSHTLHYSFGTTRGREEDDWQLASNALPLRSFLVQLVLAGFEGVLVYTSGYADNGSAEVSALSSQLGTTPILRSDGTAAFFDLSSLRARYIASIGTERAAAVRTAILSIPPSGVQHPAETVVAAATTAGRLLDAVSTPPVAAIDATFGSGCYPQEHNAGSEWNWCGNTALLTLQNHGHGRRIMLKYILSTGAPASVAVTVNGTRTTFATSPQGDAVTETLFAPAGRTVVRFTTGAQPVLAPNDPRRLVVQVSNLRVFQPPARK